MPLNLSQRGDYKWWVFVATAIGTLTSVINNGNLIALPIISRETTQSND